MAKVLKSSNSVRKTRPALTPESREQQLIGLAIDLVEQRLKDGTATSQETTHFLKLGSTKAQLEKEILENQKELISAKTESLRSTKNIEEMLQEAMDSLKRYGGNQDDGEDYDEYAQY